MQPFSKLFEPIDICSAPVTSHPPMLRRLVSCATKCSRRSPPPPMSNCPISGI